MKAADSIAGLWSKLKSLDDASRLDVSRVFHIEETLGSQEVPEALRSKCARWCGGGDDAASSAWKKAEQQRVITVHSLWTFETANFNVLRACRPVAGATKAGVNGTGELVEACAGPGRCDFCNLEELTCVEPFGRVRGKHSASAGNLFKSAGLHGLIIWDKHNPHKLTAEEMLDGLQTADAWFAKAAAWDAERGGSSVNPVLFWNCFHAAGASQLHPHMQVQLFTTPVGQEALLRSQGIRYRNTREAEGRDLCQDLVLAHRHLGLVLDLPGEVACWASLTPRVGGGELCILGPGVLGRPPLAALGGAFAAIVRAMWRCGAEAHSVIAYTIPAEGGGQAWLLRCMNRGAATPVSVDAGSAEMGGLCGSGSDPYAMLAALKEEIEAESVA